MTDVDILILLLIFAGGVLLGVLLTLGYNKLRSGSASPAKVKKEMEDYQQKVEAHFEETSDKFKAMAEQYKDLYQHLSVGATTLCRPEHIAPGLRDDRNPLQSLPKSSPEKSESPATKAEPSAGKEPSAVDSKKPSAGPGQKQSGKNNPNSSATKGRDSATATKTDSTTNPKRNRSEDHKGHDSRRRGKGSTNGKTVNKPSAGK